MVTYSPISSQSHRINISNHLQQQQLHLSNIRRRESMNSSIGATSVRRLLAVNRGSRHRVPSHIRSKILKDFIFLAVAHGLCWAILIPIFGMQGAKTIWFHQENTINLGADIGSVLLSLSFLITSGMCLLTTKIVKKFGFMTLFIAKYSGLCLFLAVHLYPTIYVLLPGYIIFGLTFGPALIAKLSIIVSIPCKLSCYQQEYGLSAVELFDENKVIWKRDESICKFARWFHAAQNFGIVCGATIAAIILTMSPTQNSSLVQTSLSSFSHLTTVPMHSESTTISTLNTIIDKNLSNLSNIDISRDENQALNTFRSSVLQDLLLKVTTTATPLNRTTSTETSYFQDIETMIQQLEYYSDEPFENSMMDQKLCGIHFCPGWDLTSITQPTYEYNVGGNDTSGGSNSNVILASTNFGQIELLGVFLGMSIVALLLICLIGTIENNMRVETLRCLSDTVIFAGPMAYFIGTEQGYMLADYTTVRCIFEY